MPLDDSNQSSFHVKQRIFIQAISLFNEKNYASVTCNEIYETLAISKEEFTSCFPTKEAVAIGMINYLGHRLLNAINTAINGDQEALIRSLSDTIFQLFFEQHGYLPIKVLSEISDNERELSITIYEYIESIKKLFLNILKILDFKGNYELKIEDSLSRLLGAAGIARIYDDPRFLRRISESIIRSIAKTSG